MKQGRCHRVVLICLVALAAPLVALGARATFADPPDQETQRAAVERAVSARKYAFSPARIEVQEGDIVKITLTAEDIPHSFTVDEYRICKRAAPGQPISFYIHADKSGTFPFYCNLTSDERCKEMRGELVVRPKPRSDAHTSSR